MRNIFLKELKLSASVLSFLFIGFGFMFFIPGYPILCGVFFSTLGIFQSFQNVKETNDILFSSLLPIAKHDVVKGKYLFVCFIETCSLFLMGIAVVCRMTFLRDAVAYRTNALMNANFFALGIAFFMFGLFNCIFVGGFFKTAYKTGRPFVLYIISAFFLIFVFEALHYIPKLGFLNAFGNDYIVAQLILLISGIILFLLLSYCSFRSSCRKFEKIDI